MHIASYEKLDTLFVTLLIVYIALVTDSFCSARLATFLRPASENFHTIKRIYKTFSNIHHYRLEAVGQPFIQHFNNKYGRKLGEEWAEYSLLYIEFLVATALYNRLHPKFFRTFPEELQLKIADRLLHLLSFPNLLLTLHIEWRLNIHLVPTPVRGLPGYGVFEFRNEQMRRVLNLPSLEEGDAWQLHVLATGPYTPRRARAALTSTREVELMEQRRSGQLGTLTEYSELAAMLPQTTPVYYFSQST